MLEDPDWNAKRWAALFLSKLGKRNLLLNDKDWRCRVFGEYLEKRHE
jgi:hypothetical protein